MQNGLPVRKVQSVGVFYVGKRSAPPTFFIADWR